MTTSSRGILFERNETLNLVLQQVPLSDILNTGNFDMEKAATAPGWLHSLRSSEPVTSESVEYGITSFVYRYFPNTSVVMTQLGDVCIGSFYACVNICTQVH